MSFLKTVGKFLLSPLGAVAGIFDKPKPQQPVLPSPAAMRNEAQERARSNDMLARRTGTRGSRRTPYASGEAPTRPKTSVLGRS